MAKIIDFEGLHYRKANVMLKSALAEDEEVVLTNVNGQRYIGAGVTGTQKIIIQGTPGNNLAAFMSGLHVIVKGNAQDGVCNTMNRGTVIVEGDTGDISGYAMRGGELFIKGDTGYRTGIHMKEFGDIVPTIVIGGKAGDFSGEYMAGGRMIVLGLNLEPGEQILGSYCGTGMHGGVIYVRGEVDDFQLGPEVRCVPMEKADKQLVKDYVERYCRYFGGDPKIIMCLDFKKLVPCGNRPYGNLYVAN